MKYLQLAEQISSPRNDCEKDRFLVRILKFWISKMLTDFALLTVLTLNSDERETLRGEINEWVKCFLPKIEKVSTRMAKCRLVASVERQEFRDYWSAVKWRFCKFVGETLTLLNLTFFTFVYKILYYFFNNNFIYHSS